MSTHSDVEYQSSESTDEINELHGPEVSHSQTSPPKLYTYIMKQDDPKKCTSAKLVRLRFASPIYRLSRLPRLSLVLNPIAHDVLMFRDRQQAERFGLVAIDCSWEKARGIFERGLPGKNRRLPIFLAANPTNYARVSKLSSLEALAAALLLLGFEEKAKDLLSLYKWGPTFYTLNQVLFDEYRKATTDEEIARIESEYF
jgi:pre-rRNA-processing protein TSR3